MMEGYTILSLLLCLSVPSALSNNVVRLAGSDGVNSRGRVEVYYEGEWGTVCHDHWDVLDAHVVCRQLGFPGAIRPTTNAQLFGAGSGSIHLDMVECKGDETSIMDCPRANFVRLCDHDEDAGVICRVDQIAISKEEDLDFHQRILFCLIFGSCLEEKEEKAAAYEGSDAKKDADLMKKDILQALYDLLVELEDK